MVDGINNLGTSSNIRAKQNMKTAEYEAKKASIFGNNSTKELKRKVDSDEKHEILVGKNKDGKKIRVDAETLEELVAVDTTGKNKYITKSEFDKMIQQVLGVKELPEGMTAEFKNGNLVFKRGGDILTSKEIREDAGLIVQKQKEKAEADRQATQNLLADIKPVPITNTDILAQQIPDIKIDIRPTPQGIESEPKETVPKVRTKKATVKETTPKPVADNTPKSDNTLKPENTPKPTPTPVRAQTKPKKIITTSHNYERGLSFANGNSIEAEDKNSVWDSDASFNIGNGKYNLKRSRSGLPTNTLDYGDLKSNNQYGFINGETGVLNPNSRLFESQHDRNPEKIYFEGKGELNGAQVLKYKNKVAVMLNGKYYDLNILMQQNKKVEIK